MLNYGIAFKKPFLDTKKLLIGLGISVASSVVAQIGPFGGPIVASVLSFVGMLIGLFVSGYYVRVAWMVLKKKLGMPEWNNWRELLFNGLIMTVLSFIYMIPLIIIMLISGMVGMSISGGEVPTLALSLTLFLIALVVGLFTFYLLPSAVLGFVKTGKFNSAFDFKTLFKKAFTKVYLAAWLVSGVYGLFLLILLSIIPWVGIPIAGFITGITGMTLLAEAYK